jgi:hypothetical protein
MKKLLASLLVGGFIALSASPVFAYAGIDDVSKIIGLNRKSLA